MFRYHGKKFFTPGDVAKIEKKRDGIGSDPDEVRLVLESLRKKCRMAKREQNGQIGYALVKRNEFVKYDDYDDLMVEIEKTLSVPRIWYAGCTGRTVTI